MNEQDTESTGLLGLAGEADALSGGDGGGEIPPGGDQAAPGAAPEVTNASLIAGVLECVREGFCLATKLESPRRTFTSDHATQLGQAWGAVCDKRGIDLKRWLGDFGMEFAALMLTVQIFGEVRTAAITEGKQRAAAAAAAKSAAGNEGQAA